MLSTLSFKRLYDFLVTMYQEEQEDSLWRIYLSSPLRDESYNSWKEKIVGSGRTKEEIEQEALQAEEHALDLLNGMSGGDADGG